MKNITIIIPVYNAEKYLARCFESILNQSIYNFYVLVVNDGSTDESQKVIDRYCAQYPDIFISVIQSNMGVALTRNKALKMVDTEYVMFMDNDDYIDVNYVETLYNAIDKEKLDIVISGYRRPDKDGSIVYKRKLYNSEWSKLEILVPWGRIFRTKYLIENRIEYFPNDIGEDIFFNLIAYFETEKIKTLSYIGYNWYYNNDSVSNTIQKDARKLNVIKLLDSCYDTIKDRDLLDGNYEILEAFFIKYIFWYVVFSGYKLPYRHISSEYDKVLSWLKDHFPKYTNNKLFTLRFPEEDSIKERMYTVGMLLLCKLGLGKIAVYIITRFKDMK